MINFIRRNDNSIIGNWIKQVDLFSIAILTVLLVIGTILITSAGPATSLRIDASNWMFVKKHYIFAPLAFLTMLFVSFLNIQQLKKICLYTLPLILFFLILTLVQENEVKGANRWLSIFGFTIQISELLKPILALFIAFTLTNFIDSFKIRWVFLLITTIITVAILLLLEPDIGQTMIILSMLGVQCFIAGLKPLHVFLLALCTILLAAFLYLTFPYAAKRVDNFISSQITKDYQTENSILAIKNGDLFGTGLGSGKYKYLLPDSHSDFIFSVAAEELGIILCIGILIIYGLLIFRITNQIAYSFDRFKIIAVSGLISYLMIQVLINTASSLLLIPTKGTTLPFISYGGSSLLATGFAFGAILALSRNNPLIGQSEDDIN